MVKKLFETNRVSVLAHFDVADDHASCLFHPYAFDVAAGATPVLAVTFVAPQFSRSDMAAIEPEEVCSIEIYEDRLEFWSGFDPHDDTPNVLHAASVSWEWRSYAPEDFRSRVEQLESSYQNTNSELYAAERHRQGVRTFILESIHRAEIKAALSDDQKLRQQEAIAALQRVLHRLDDEPSSG